MTHGLLGLAPPTVTHAAGGHDGPGGREVEVWRVLHKDLAFREELNLGGKLNFMQ